MTAQAPAKINAFLKITGRRANYHEMISRFIKIPELSDTISFNEVNQSSEFTLDGNFNCTLEDNTIYKAYQLLLENSDKQKIKKFFEVHTVTVDKKIPSFAGLGGGSSDAATFMNMCNEHIGLGFDKDELASFGVSIGADIPFFIYDYNVANVSGIGDLVAPFEDEGLKFNTFTPDIECDTAKVFQHYAAKYYAPISKSDKRFFATLKTKEALELYNTNSANDLFKAAADIYPDLIPYATKNQFFSGSGSTFFSLKD
jgi:4-diphosphocytidyl-2-C-methyl-D-erythritol kinase